MADEHVHLALEKIEFSADQKTAHVRLRATYYLPNRTITDLSLTFEVPDYESLDEAVGKAREQLQLFAASLLQAANSPLPQRKPHP
jgi:hypothetical protein